MTHWWETDSTMTDKRRLQLLDQHIAAQQAEINTNEIILREQRNTLSALRRDRAQLLARIDNA